MKRAGGAAMFLVVGCSAALAGQPDPATGVPGAEAGRPRAAVPAVPTPREVFRRLAQRYRGGLVCERVSIEVRPDSGRVARSFVLVRTRPGTGGESPSPRMYGLEMGALKVSAGGGMLTAVHTRNPGTFFGVELSDPVTAPALRAHLAPVPCPQLDLLEWAGGSGDESEPLPAQITPYARSIQWTDVTPDPRAPDRFTLRGTCEGGSISMVIRGDLLLTVDIALSESATTIRLAISASTPCRDSDLEIETDGRTRVQALSDLQPRAGMLRAGSAVPDLSLTGPAGQGVRLSSLFTPPADFQPAPDAERCVIVFVRTRRAEGQPLQRMIGSVRLEQLARELANLQRESYQPPAPSGGEPGPAGRVAPVVPPITYAQVVVWESAPPADVLLATLKSEREAWGDHLAWTTEPRSTVDLFASSGESAAVVIDSKRRLLLAVPIAEGATTEQLMDQISLAVFEGVDERPGR